MSNPSASLVHRSAPGQTGIRSQASKLVPMALLGLGVVLVSAALTTWLNLHDIALTATFVVLATALLGLSFVLLSANSFFQSTAPAESADLLCPIINRLIENPDSSAPFTELLTSLAARLRCDYASIHLVEEDSGRLTTLSSSNDAVTEELGRQINMDILTAIEHSRSKVVSFSPGPGHEGFSALGLRDGALLYGFVLVKEKRLSVSENAFLLDVVERLAATIICTRRARANQRRVVYKERATIARELHDSLAQSLSYLKIQSTRLQAEIDKSRLDNNADHAKLDNAISELRTNLNLAYSQLRELMTTFRLTMNGKNLAHAIDESISEFRKRTNIAFDSDIRLSGEELSVQEELQLLQIVREGLSNVVRHSQASRASISLSQSHGLVQLHIIDDGVGMDNIPDSNQHHGLVIIQERTRRLDGNLYVSTPENGGTRLEISFTSRALQQ